MAGETIDLVQVDTTAINASLDATTEKIVDLEAAQKSLRDEMKKTDKELDKEGKSRKELSKQMALNADELGDLKKQRRDNIKLIKSENNSLGQLEKRQKTLITERKKLNLATDEGKSRLKEINVEYAENKAAIDEATNKQHAFTDALTEMTEENKKTNEQLSSMSEAAEGAGGGIGGLVGGLKAFLTNPYVAIFAAIAGVVTAIGSAFKGSRAGSVFLEKSMTNLSAVTDVAKGRFSNFVTEMQNGKKSSRDLVIEIGKWVTGQKQIEIALDKSEGSLRKQVETVRDLKKELIDLNDAYIDVENELQTQIVTLRGLGEIQASTADDATRSLQERRAAAQSAANLDKQAGEAAVELAGERLAIAEKEIEVGIAAGALLREQNGTLKSLTKDGIELEKAYTEASIAAIEASNELARTRIENEKRLREINQDDFEQELDFLLDIADASKTVNEQQIADQRLALDERKAILNETNALIEDSFDDQVALFERDLGVQLERNKILDLNNQEVFQYARGLELSGVATDRLREVIIERRKAIQDLATAERDINEEESERRAEALVEIEAFEAAKFEQMLGSAEAVRDFRIAEAEAAYQEEIANKNLLDEEIQALEVAHLSKLDKINEDYRKKQEKEDKKAAQNKRQLQLTAIDIAKTSFNGFVQYQNQQNQARLDTEIAAADGNEQKINEIRERFAKEERKRAIKQALVNAALGALKTIASVGFPAAIPLLIAQAVATGAAIATISNQKFADGGEVKAWQVNGPSHSGGGIPLSIGGRSAGEIEGGEGVYVVNERDNPAAVAALSSINSISGKPFAPSSYMQDGGEAVPATPGISFEEALALSEARPIQVQVVDITDGQATEVEVIGNGEV